MANTFVAVLKSKNFAKLWVGQVTSQIAYNMVNFLIVLHIYELTKSSTSISLVLIASAIPSVLFGSLSGVLADRFNYKKILVYTSFLRFLSVIILIFSSNNTLGLLEVVFLIATISQFFQPAESASIPMIVSKTKLIAANSVAITTTYATMLLGYAIAGPLMSAITSRGTLLLAAALYLISSYSLMSMKNYDFKEITRISLTNIAHTIEQVWAQTKGSVIYLFKSDKIIIPVIKLSIGWVVLGSFVVILPAFAQQEIKLSTQLVGPLLIAPAGLGMVLGANYIEKKARFSFNRATNTGFILTGLSLAIFAAYRYYSGWYFAIPFAIILMILMGAFCSVVYISSQTMLQTKSEEAMRGRIFGAASMFTNIAMSIPALLIGGLSDLFSPFVILATLSIALIIYGFISSNNESGNHNYLGRYNA